MAVVTEKTGYPTEMLEPGMALDTDLGIDSIKRVGSWRPCASACLHCLSSTLPSWPGCAHWARSLPIWMASSVHRQHRRRPASRLQFSLLTSRCARGCICTSGSGSARDHDGGGDGEDGLPDRDAGAGDGARHRSGYRLDQACRDPGGHARARACAAEFDTSIMAGLRTLGEIVAYMDGQLAPQPGSGASVHAASARPAPRRASSPAPALGSIGAIHFKRSNARCRAWRRPF